MQSEPLCILLGAAKSKIVESACVCMSWWTQNCRLSHFHTSPEVPWSSPLQTFFNNRRHDPSSRMWWVLLFIYLCNNLNAAVIYEVYHILGCDARLMFTYVSEEPKCLIACLAYFSTLKIQAVRSFETSVNFWINGRYLVWPGPSTSAVFPDPILLLRLLTDAVLLPRLSGTQFRCNIRVV
jgi:hypothetical protein